MADESDGVVSFGMADGLATILGLLLPLSLNGRSTAVVLEAAIGVAVASAIGMAAGEWLGDGSGSLRRAALMGLASLMSILLPAGAYGLTTGVWRVVAVTLVILALACVVAWYRPPVGWHPRGWIQTFGILAAVATVCSVVAIVLPGGS